jgi:hypothetical protein
MKTTKIIFFMLAIVPPSKCEQNGHSFSTYDHIKMDKIPFLVINCSHFIYRDKKETWSHNNLFSDSQYHTMQKLLQFPILHNHSNA